MKPIPANQLLAGLALAGSELISDVVTDSRKVTPGCVFVCFPGARVDGHDYAAAAFRAGAAYIVANHPVDGVPEDRTVLVASSHRAMVRMSSNYRTLFSPLMIGVTGSVGKTTTKEFCYAVLSAFGNTLKTEGNQNNEIGLPNTLFRLDDATEYAVVEMGMSALGEIDRLTRAARPSAGIITRIGVSHLENLGSRENILKAKLEICHGLPDGAPLVLNADDDLLPTAKLPDRLRPVWFGIDSETADVRAVKIQPENDGTRFVLSDREHGEFPVFIPTVGLHTVSDALRPLHRRHPPGAGPGTAPAALSNYHTDHRHAPAHRAQGGHHGGGGLLQRQPGQPRAALKVLQGIRPAGRHIALLGDMLSWVLSARRHTPGGGLWAAGAGVDLVIAYGPLSEATAKAAAERGVATLHCTDPQEVVGYVRQNVHAGDALLAKASHAMQLEEILARFYQTVQ